MQSEIFSPWDLSLRLSRFCSKKFESNLKTSACEILMKPEDVSEIPVKPAVSFYLEEGFDRNHSCVIEKCFVNNEQRD